MNQNFLNCFNNDSKIIFHNYNLNATEIYL